MRRLSIVFFVIAYFAGEVVSQEPSPPRILVVPLEDQIIQPVTVRFVTRVLRQAAERGDICVILQLDTPGGLMDSTRHLVKEILTSNVPVVVYIAPSGARAGSAGVFITLSAHVAAMAPGTNIGAAHPIALGGAPMPMPMPMPAPNADKNEGAAAKPGQDILSEKITNDAVAWARALADQRGRNSDWAVRAIRDSISTPANEAVREGVVDFIAADQDELLRKLDGRTVALKGRSVVLRTRGVSVEHAEMSWPERCLSLLANPTIAYLLLLLGFAGLMFEITHPGTWIAGMLGLTCLILAFFAMQMLPINYAGLALIVLGLLLIVLELKVHSFGILAATSIVCLLLGSAMLIEPVGGVERVSWLVVAPVTVALVLIMMLLVRNVVRAHRGAVQTGMEKLIGAVACVRGDMNGRGYVFVAGELWQACCDLPLQDGEAVVIQKFEGLTLYVKPVGSE